MEIPFSGRTLAQHAQGPGFSAKQTKGGKNKKQKLGRYWKQSSAYTVGSTNKLPLPSQSMCMAVLCLSFSFIYCHLILLAITLYRHTFVYLYMVAHRSVSAEVRGQLVGTGSLLPCGFLGLDSGHEGLQQTLFPTEPTCQPSPLILIFKMRRLNHREIKNFSKSQVTGTRQLEPEKIHTYCTNRLLQWWPILK